MQTMTPSADYFRYWGKANPESSEGPAYHLLVYHSLDVAAVGARYLSHSKSLLTAICRVLECEQEAFLSFATFVMALHDLGKFSEAFQSQRPDLIQTLQQREPNSSKQYTERHDSLGYWLWNELSDKGLLVSLQLANKKQNHLSLKPWMQAVTGHHGMPPKSDGPCRRFFTDEDQTASQRFVLAMADLLLTDPARKLLNQPIEGFEEIGKSLSWWFAGVTVLADWLGSNTKYFPYQSTPSNLNQYWSKGLEMADIALGQTGVLPIPIAEGKCVQDFFPYIEKPTPLQQWASSVALSAMPQIHLLEDVTGAGKTEAAMVLAYRLMAQGSASGFYIGLPTMATANAMYERVAKVYQTLFAGDASLALAHGSRHFVEQFARSIVPDSVVEHDENQHDQTASARCTAWLADHGKRALLASAGVGTIDQALLAVLHSKHQSLRLLGLYNKVLVIDEVHACDAYMLGVLAVLLEFHARSDGSVILLSATLTQAMKQSLLDAYAKGRQYDGLLSLRSTSYPLASSWSNEQGALSEMPLASRANVSRVVKVRYTADEESVYQHVVRSLHEGKCVVWIRNTVADVLASYARLFTLVNPEKITVFHSRFALSDRLRIEQQVLEFFGPANSPTSRCGRLLIASQVAEQSLDIDADELISDLAPIDRLLQRAGRLHRHIRHANGDRISGSDGVMNDGRSEPCLWVYGPEWTDSPSSDWFAAAFPKGQYVYPHHGRLWRTARLLQSGAFTMPQDARRLVESVFSESVDLPPSLEQRAITVKGEEMSEASLAQMNTLKIDTGYLRGDLGDWWADALTPTRLGEKTVQVMLARWVDGVCHRWAEGVWAYSVCKISAHRLAKVVLPTNPAHLRSYEAALATLPDKGEWSILLPLSLCADGTWQASAYTLGNEKKRRAPELLTWVYDDSQGLRWQDKSKAP